MKRSKIISFIYCVILMSCGGSHSDPTPKAPQNFFTIQISPNYLVPDEFWLMAEDEKGTTLYSHRVVAGEQTIIFNGIVPDAGTFRLHFLSLPVSSITTQHNLVLTTYTDVPINGTWKLEPVFLCNDANYEYCKGYSGYSGVDAPLGEAFLTLKNYKGSDNKIVKFSTPKSIYGFEDGTYTYTDILTHQDHADYFVTYFSDGNPKLVKFQNVSPYVIDTVDVAVSSISMDKQFAFDYSKDKTFYGYFYGYKTGDDTNFTGYINSDFYSDPNTPGPGNVNLGYINGQDIYKTYVYHGQASSSQTYYKLGSPMSQLPSIPSFNVVVNNPSILNFSAQSNIEYDYATITYKNTYYTYFTWTINTPQSSTSKQINLKTMGFPGTTGRIEFDMTKMKIESVSVTKFLDATKYVDFLNQKESSSSGTPIEYYTLSENIQ